MIITASVLNDLFEGSILNVIYAVALAAGLMYTLFLIFFQGIGDALGDLDIAPHMDMDLDVDADFGDTTGAQEAMGISMLAIASFVSAFGAFGLISVTLLDAGPAVSMIIALIAGTVIGLLAQLFFVYILSNTISSEVHQAALVGMTGEITTPIPADGVGQIALVAKGARITYTARATDNQKEIHRGTPVRIERIVGGIAYVSEID